MATDHPIIKPPKHPIDHVYPLRRRRGRVEPFPTIYYLTDAGLVHRLSELERRQGVKQMEQRLRADPEAMGRFHDDHAAYRDERWRMLTEADRRLVAASASLRRAFAGGVAGVADFDHVKCLHAHYAYHLARQMAGSQPTLLSSWIDEALPELAYRETTSL
jgi:hypothetical protein